eukprot:7864436-Alexandrium_andersonii.AAC.1
MCIRDSRTLLRRQRCSRGGGLALTSIHSPLPSGNRRRSRRTLRALAELRGSRAQQHTEGRDRRHDGRCAHHTNQAPTPQLTDQPSHPQPRPRASRHVTWADE